MVAWLWLSHFTPPVNPLTKKVNGIFFPSPASQGRRGVLSPAILLEQSIVHVGLVVDKCIAITLADS